jgi:XTP/dITP diphosphohydrolase
MQARPRLPFQRVVLASGNPGKLREFAALFAPLGVELVPQASLSISEAEEPHPSFLENALAKARHASRASGLPALADDSGICVDALQGQPGVRSARFAPPQPGRAQDDLNNERLVADLRGVQDRSARYVCVLVLLRSWDDPIPLVAEGSWQGQVIDTPRGQGGFGYDRYFWLPAEQATAAELSAEHKNRISHRAIAVRSLFERLPDWAGSGPGG